MRIKIFEAQYGHQKYPLESKKTESTINNYLIGDIRLFLHRKNGTISIICYINALESYSRSEMYYVFYEDSISQNTFTKFHKNVIDVLSEMELQLSNSEKNNMFKHIIDFDQKSHKSFDIEYSALAKSIEHKEKLEYNYGDYDAIAKLCGNILYNSTDVKIVIQSKKNSDILNADVSICTDFSERQIKPTNVTHKIIEKYKSNIQNEKRKRREHEENEKRKTIADESFRSIKKAVLDLKEIGLYEDYIVKNLVDNDIFSKDFIIKYTSDFNNHNADKSHLGQQDDSFSDSQSPFMHKYTGQTMRPEAAKRLDTDKKTQDFLNSNTKKGNNRGERKNAPTQKEHLSTQPYSELKPSAMESGGFNFASLIRIAAIIVVFAIIVTGVSVLYVPNITTSAPQITSVIPTNITASNFTIIGTNFDDAIVQILNAENNYLVDQGTIINQSDTKIVVRQFMSETEGVYVVKVKNADGQLSNDFEV